MHHRHILGLAIAAAYLNADAGQPASGGAVSPATPAAPVNIKTEPKEANFHFKKEKIKDNEGKVIGEGKKLPSVKATVPVPTAEGALDIVTAGGKALELLQDVMFDVVFERGRQIINAWREANPDKEVPADLLKPEDLDWVAIANLPKAERRGLGISDEEWDAFFENYREVMPLATGKDKDRIEKHIAIYKKKFAAIRNDKKALGVLGEMLALYATSTPSLEENAGVYEYLKKRVETLLAEDEKVLAEAL